MKIESITAEQGAVLAEWNAADANQKKYREQELALRSRVMREIFGMDKDTTDTDEYKGTHYANLGNGWRLKVECKTDYALQNKNGETDDVLDKFDPTTAELLVRWKPELSVSNFKNLPAESQVLFNDCLTVKNSTPAFELVAPKAK